MESNKQYIRNIIKEIISKAFADVSTKDRLHNLRNYVKDHIEFEGTPYDHVSESELIPAVIQTFKEEKGWDIENKGLKRAFIDYLRGMPSFLDIATYYDEIRNLLYALGYDEVKGMDDMDIDKLYYNELYNVFFGGQNLA